MDPVKSVNRCPTSSRVPGMNDDMKTHLLAAHHSVLDISGSIHVNPIIIPYPTPLTFGAYSVTINPRMPKL